MSRAGITDTEGRLRIAIKMAARRGARYRPHETWGDFHFAEGIARAFERRGHSVRIDPPWTWYERPDPPDDVVLVLRGLMAYVPRPGPINLMWHINHAEDVTFEEYDAYDLAYVASPSYAALVRQLTPTPVRTLMQATDPGRFRPPRRPAAPTYDVLFVGNSRLEYREIVRWAVEEGIEPEIYGTGWEAFVPDRLVRGTYIENRDLAAHYGAARITLCDHFASMRDFGFVANRLFDVIASGGRVVSDHIPSIGRLFGPAAATVRNPAELRQALEADGDGAQMHEGSHAASVLAEHTFDHRVAAVLDDVALIREGAAHRLADEGRGRRERGVARLGLIRVHLVCRDGAPDDAAYARLVQPLTDDASGAELSVGGIAEPVPEDAAVCVVQADAETGAPHAEALIRTLAGRGVRLVADLDGPAGGEGAGLLLDAADRIWVADAAVVPDSHRRSGKAEIVAAQIDRRLFNDYGAERPTVGIGEELRVLVLDRPAGSCDLARAIAALAGAAVRFDATIVSSAPVREHGPGLRIVRPPEIAAAYPGFVRWLKTQQAFDAAILAPPEPSWREAYRAAELAALGIATIAIAPSEWARGIEGVTIAEDQAALERVFLRLSEARRAERLAVGAAKGGPWTSSPSEGAGEKMSLLLAGLVSEGRPADEPGGTSCVS